MMNRTWLESYPFQLTDTHEVDVCESPKAEYCKWYCCGHIRCHSRLRWLEMLTIWTTQWPCYNIMNGPWRVNSSLYEHTVNWTRKMCSSLCTEVRNCCSITNLCCGNQYPSVSTHQVIPFTFCYVFDSFCSCQLGNYIYSMYSCYHFPVFSFIEMYATLMKAKKICRL
jgi:hypothetical protein